MRPDLSIGYSGLAQLYLQAGKLEQARWFAEAALRMGATAPGESLQMYRVLAAACRQLGHARAAETAAAGRGAETGVRRGQAAGDRSSTRGHSRRSHEQTARETAMTKRHGLWAGWMLVLRFCPLPGAHVRLVQHHRTMSDPDGRRDIANGNRVSAFSRRQRSEVPRRSSWSRAGGCSTTTGTDSSTSIFSTASALKGTTVSTPSAEHIVPQQRTWTSHRCTSKRRCARRRPRSGCGGRGLRHDGYQDLYVNNFGPDVFYRNDGDGTFTDITRPLQVEGGDHLGAGTGMLDIDADGDLDLYVANYVAFTYERHAKLIGSTFPYPPGPMDFPPCPIVLFRNNGDGSFTDVSGVRASAVAGPMGCSAQTSTRTETRTFSSATTWRQTSISRTTDTEISAKSASSRVGLQPHGHANGSMGVECGDYDHDGQLDLFMTDYTGEMPVLYRNARRRITSTT